VTSTSRQFADYESTIKHLNTLELNNTWQQLNKSIVLALVNEVEESKGILRKIVIEETETKWQTKRKEFAQLLLSKIDSENELDQYIPELVSETRKLKGLPELHDY
jgi:hypothetical protein